MLLLHFIICFSFMKITQKHRFYIRKTTRRVTFTPQNQQFESIKYSPKRNTAT
jgi:hypothetical protein